MYEANVMNRLGFPLGERQFFILAIVCIIIIRLAVILVTPSQANKEDPRIYQGTGQTVLAGVNPYNFADQPQLRQILRKKMATSPKFDIFTGTQKNWDYYVSSNLPASTALYVIFEEIAHGSRFVWRLLFILGDISIFLGFVTLFKVTRGGLNDAYDQIGIFCMTALYPALIFEGTVIPEDKQFQTALMLFASALLISPKRTTLWRGLGGGVILSLSVLFKLFGIFLVPLWLVRVRKEWPRFGLWTFVGGIVPLCLSFLAFGPYFIDTIGSRAANESGVVAAHASPWTLLPEMLGGPLLAAKAVVVLAGLGGLSWLLAKRRIDLLNFCAGFAVVVVCFWLSKGSLNRYNIVIMFAIACLVTIAPHKFFLASIFATFVSGAVYVIGLGMVIGLGVLHPWEHLQAVLVLLLVLAYAAILAMPRYTEPRLRTL